MPWVSGRHLLGTLCGLHAAYNNLSQKKSKKFHAHLTILDHYDVMLARVLSVLMLLHQLNTRPDTTEQLEIQATLMYMYCGVAMPSYCHDRYASSNV